GRSRRWPGAGSRRPVTSPPRPCGSPRPGSPATSRGKCSPSPAAWRGGASGGTTRSTCGRRGPSRSRDGASRSAPTEHLEQLASVALDLRRTESLHVEQGLRVRGARGGERGERLVVEDDVRGDPVLACPLAAPVAQLL